MLQQHKKTNKVLKNPIPFLSLGESPSSEVHKLLLP